MSIHHCICTVDKRKLWKSTQIRILYLTISMFIGYSIWWFGWQEPCQNLQFWPYFNPRCFYRTWSLPKAADFISSHPSWKNDMVFTVVFPWLYTLHNTPRSRFGMFRRSVGKNDVVFHQNVSYLFKADYDISKLNFLYLQFVYGHLCWILVQPKLYILISLFLCYERHW